MKSLYLIILLIAIVSYHAFGAETALGGAQPETQSVTQPADTQTDDDGLDFARAGDRAPRTSAHRGAPGNHHGGIFRNFSETTPADLANHGSIVYRGRNNDGKACSLELTFNGYGDISAGRMISGEDSLQLDATKVEVGLGTFFRLPSLAVIDSTDYLSFPPQNTEREGCKVNFSFKKRGTEITGMAARRSCQSDWGWPGPALQCVRMKRVRD